MKPGALLRNIPTGTNFGRVDGVEVATLSDGSYYLKLTVFTEKWRSKTLCFELTGYYKYALIDGVRRVVRDELRTAKGLHDRLLASLENE
jgi:hypothetical protein